MGNETHDQQYPKKIPCYINQQTQSQNHKFKSFLLIIFTNLVTIYILTSPFSFLNKNSSMNTSDSIFILKELNSTKAQLVASNIILSELHQRLNSTNLLVQALLIDLNREQEKQSVSWTARNDLEKDFDEDGLDFGLDQVLATKAETIRIGLDIGGTGTFVVRMKERNVTIITSTLNLDGPFASRGLIPMYVNISQRLPFFENTMDIVHSKDVIGNWMQDSMVEFVLNDIYRVLRPGGLFWLDHFFCFGSQLNKTYVPMLDRVGFNKLRWHVGIKLDPKAPKDVWHISALMEKPMI